MRKAISVIAIAVAAIIGSTGIASASEPDYTVRSGDTLSELNPRAWREVCIVNVAEGRISNCDLIITGQRIRRNVSVQERQAIGQWFAALEDRGAAPAPARAAVGAHKPGPASSPAACSGLEGVNEPLASKTCAAMRACGGGCWVTSGYRSTDHQIGLRREHCGTSDYAIFRMPASDCDPPTARPGESKHETGDAVDMSPNSAPYMTAQGLVTPVDGESWHWELP